MAGSNEDFHAAVLSALVFIAVVVQRLRFPFAFYFNGVGGSIQEEKSFDFLGTFQRQLEVEIVGSRVVCMANKTQGRSAVHEAQIHKSQQRFGRCGLQIAGSMLEQDVLKNNVRKAMCGGCKDVGLRGAQQ